MFYVLCLVMIPELSSFLHLFLNDLWESDASDLLIAYSSGNMATTGIVEFQQLFVCYRLDSTSKIKYICIQQSLTGLCQSKVMSRECARLVKLLEERIYLLLADLA
jgi:hypothetical protein